MNIATLIRDIQATLDITADGVAGPQTWAAIHAKICGVPANKAGAFDTFVAANNERVDERSEKQIATLHPRVQSYARALVLKAQQRGITIVVTSGTRSYAEQDALFNQPRDGKDNDGDGRIDESDERVTRAPAGYSNHNFGLAFDVTIFSDGKPVWESPNYKAVGSMGMGLGLEWGGNWTSITDEPHFELRPQWAANLSESQMLAELRRRKTLNMDAFA